VLDDIAAHARGALPLECCGVLVGKDGEITFSVRSANLADDPLHRFLLDPRTHFDAMRYARVRGLAVVGFYHSHPQSEPAPSPTDLEGAAYPDHWYLIVRPLPVECEARLWRLEGTGFIEVELLR
jgi:proteasome lid subunit RPN8/RPN11